MKAVHEQEIEVKRNRLATERFGVRVTVDLASLARQFGPRAALNQHAKVRLLENAVIVERVDPPPDGPLEIGGRPAEV